MDNEGNVLLVLMRLDRSEPNPIHARVGSKMGGKRFLQEGTPYQLLAGVLDPAQRAPSAPFALIELSGTKLKTYNRILSRFQEIWGQFYSQGGFVDEPQTYINECQAELLEDISVLGNRIYQLFLGGNNPVRDWLDRLLSPNASVRTKVRPVQSVTIITNDFDIPWFWLKAEIDGPFLCEACSLGMLQLSAAGGRAEPSRPISERKDTYEALLIKGSADLPFIDHELDTITDLMQNYQRGAVRSFAASRAGSVEEILGLLPAFRSHRNFSIVHFSGHYSGENLLLKEKALAIGLLRDVLDGALLVLDGCSSARELEAWTDVGGLTSTLINLGAVGCLVTVLPVKHDPIVNRVLWEAFYRELRWKKTSVGQALLKARIALRDHFDKIGSSNPSWAVYQLIGSPVVQLCEEGEGDGDAS